MDTETLPGHVAIIMDGNGRWARQRHMPRIAGHKVGLDVVRNTVRRCIERNIKILTVFAFSSENWKRSPEEVTYLMNLFRSSLSREVDALHKQNIKLSIVGDRSRFDSRFCDRIHAAETLTKNNTALHLVIAFNYGGRWDIAQAVARLVQDVGSDASSIALSELYTQLQKRLCLSDLPEPDLLIRTGGEKRISNFFLWQLAYTELYFTDIFWPDFTVDDLDHALMFFAGRERRFGGAT